MKKSNIVTLLIFFLLIPATLFLGTKIPGRSYYITSTLMILELMIPFFMAFEGRKPQARELVVIAVMCAIAIVARTAIPIPHFK
ncbi:MAG: ECF transporter S component, partial [Clostridia bacterium]|nr:ECF transporter S component [Clostridia bacterium]